VSNVTVKHRANDIPLSLNMYREANSQGITFSQLLEQEDPSSEYGADMKLDAFERQMQRFGIQTHSMPERGIWASPVEKFYIAADGTKGDVIFPEFVNRIARRPLVADNVLNEIVGITTPIDSNAYRSIYVEYDTKAASKRRVTQGADMPVAQMKLSEKTINLYKYGRRLQFTYEAVRRMRIDQLALHIEYLMLQAGLDRASDAYDVLANGDGNSNPAVNYNKTALQTGTTSDPLSYAGWATFLFNFYPYQMSTLIGGKNELVAFLTMQAPNVDPIRLIEQLRFGQANSQGEMAQSIFNNYKIVYLPDATANKLVGFDKRYSVEMVVEIGSDITETQKLITSQWQEIVISEVNGFGVFLKDARRTLTLNA
jgi:hypothetical protein